jgi:hypothetical protein
VGQEPVAAHRVVEEHDRMHFTGVAGELNAADVLTGPRGELNDRVAKTRATCARSCSLGLFERLPSSTRRRVLCPPRL